MDGTLAFINGHPGFAVSIALVAQDGTPQIGVVYDPSTNNTTALSEVNEHLRIVHYGK